MQIGSRESYDFNYDLKKGVELKFHSSLLPEYEELCQNYVERKNFAG